jgi:Fe-S cluster assembly ATP-binding protein
MAELIIEDLHASAGGEKILRGLSLTVRSGEVHAVMGPNGSGKSTLSHVVTGKPGYEVTGGSVTLDGADMLALSAYERAAAGLFLAMQYPTEVPGVSLDAVLREALAARGSVPSDLDEVVVAETAELGLTAELVGRSLNVDLSGGEKKRNETLQLAVLQPRIAILDELDSGLDIDGLRQVSRRIERATNESDLGVLAITHYSRLLTELKADKVHILVDGAIVDSGGAKLADELEESGYERWLPTPETSVSIGGLGGLSSSGADPFAEPLL